MHQVNHDRSSISPVAEAVITRQHAATDLPAKRGICCRIKIAVQAESCSSCTTPITTAGGTLLLQQQSSC